MDGRCRGQRATSAFISLYFALILPLYIVSRYFGRAKELPGVKELFQSRKKEEDEETATQGFYKRFTNQGPAYFGDLDEVDGELLKYEQAAEENGASVISFPLIISPSRLLQHQWPYRSG